MTPAHENPLVDKLARALLYEGYMLYPYRPSVKNHQRWTFGGVYPPAWSAAQNETTSAAGAADPRNAIDPCVLQTQCLLETQPATAVHIRIRFLHLVDRAVGELETPVQHWPARDPPPYRPVQSAEINGRRYESWQEAIEQSIDLAPLQLLELLNASTDRPIRHPFSFPAHQSIEPLQSPGNPIATILIRRRQSISGTIEVSAAPVAEDLFRLALRILNLTELPPASADSHREDILLHSLVSTHVILTATAGNFVSLTDPPEAHRPHAAQCTNIGLWPVLVGEAPDRSTLLASPIIVEDYPRIAPESPGDLFDATEIDEILTLRILTLTDDEKRRAAASDDRVRDLLARTQSLARDELMNLHGTLREVTPSPLVNSPHHESPHIPAASPPKRIIAHGTELKPGDSVRLRPLGRADVFDLALDGKSATIVSIEQDFENRVYLAVTIDDDPGKDLGALGQPGHRFFFGIEEVEPLKPEAEPLKPAEALS